MLVRWAFAAFSGERGCRPALDWVAGVYRGGKLQSFDHPEEVWRWLEMWDKVSPGPSGRSGVDSAHTSGVDDTAWRRCGDGLLRVSAQRCDNSVSRI
ncbi:hypothetical protein NDU88_006089 [Pleurodeles waltl]|uniref:Uncharacterized protein n=1 Tax=Pleurodeles waltl TaxID=8319 RepID=A0AAV7W9S9_PLEWA|nr:hypothetical protein NDU88_006089 [Pleurodeles waltl]